MSSTIDPLCIALTDLVDTTKYQHVNGSEFLLMVKVENATSAISEGRYKEVVTTIAQCIATLRTTCAAENIRIQHDGDRLIAIAGISAFFKACETIHNLESWIAREYGLSVVSRTWSGSQLKKDGHTFRYAALMNTNGSKQWQFHCDTMDVLESEMHSDGERIYPYGKQELPVLSGFRSDFSPISTQGACYACFRVRFRYHHVEDRTMLFRALLSLVGNYAQHGLSSPVTSDELQWLTDDAQLKEMGKQMSYYRQRKRWNLVFRWMNRSGLHHRQPYQRWLFQAVSRVPASVCHISYNGDLKMVFCVRNDRMDELEKELQELEILGQMDIGLHWSDEVFITGSLSPVIGDLFFIDGTDGGLTAAAERLGGIGIKNVLA